MGQLGRDDRSAVAGIASELAVYRPDSAPVLPQVMGAVHELLGGATASIFSLAEANGGLALTRCHLIDFPARFEPLFARFLSSAPRRYGIYDAARPEPNQRNRVVLSTHICSREDLESQPMYKQVFHPAGIGDHEQLRVLLCEGASLLAWFGITDPATFSTRQRRLLAALARPMRRRLLLERRMARGERAGLALEAALEHIAIPAFVVGRHGVIHEMNAAGRSVLEARRGELRRAVVDAIAGRPHQPVLQLVPLHARGLAPHWLVLIPAAAPHDRLHAQLAAAATRWGLTRRETEVASWIARGATNQRIAAELGCAEHTVEVHVSRILAKADLASRAELVATILA